MAQGFFKHIPNIEYDFKSDGKYYLAKDLFRKVSVWNYLQEGVAGYSYYRINEGERPDVVASKLYGDATLYWTFWLVNENLQDHSDWPKSQRLFQKFLDRKYSGKCLVATNPTDIVSYDHTEETSNKFLLGEKVAEGTSEIIGSNVTNGKTVTLENVNSFIKVGMVVTGGANPGDLPLIQPTEITGYTTVSAINGTTLTLSTPQTLVDSPLTTPLAFSSLTTYGFVTDVNPTHNRITIQIPLNVTGSFTVGASAVGVNSAKSFTITSIQNERDAVNHYTDDITTYEIAYEKTGRVGPDGYEEVVAVDGDEIMTHSFKTTVSTNNTAVTNEKYELDLNEESHVIRYIPAGYIARVVREFVSLVRD